MGNKSVQEAAGTWACRPHRMWFMAALAASCRANFSTLEYP